MTQFLSPGYPAILRLPTALRRNAIICAVALIVIATWLWVSNPCARGACHVNQTVEKLRSTVLAEDGFPKQFPKNIWQTSKERQDTEQEVEMKPADKEGSEGEEAKKQAPEEDGKETNDEDGEVLKTNPSTVAASRLDSIKGQPTIGKISILFGKPNPTYERALRLHDVQNQYYDYPMFILRENLLHGLWSKPAYILSVLLQELAKPKESRLKWLMYVCPFPQMLL